MKEKEISKRLEAALESLSRIEHERWSHWQRYMHSKSQLQPDGSLVVPAELVTRWSRQMSTGYDDLPPEEQESDRDQVRRYLPALIQALADK